MNSSAYLPTPVFWVATVILAGVLIRLVVIDLHTRRLPDKYTLPLVLSGLAVNAYALGAIPTLAIWGAIMGYLVFWAIGAFYFRARGIEGLGMGDAKLLAAAGAWLGIAMLPMLILMAATAALVFALAGGRRAREQLAFGPWLAAAFIILWVAGA